MSALELRPFEEQLANVIYANRLEQAETRGKKRRRKKYYNKTPKEKYTRRNMHNI